MRLSEIQKYIWVDLGSIKICFVRDYFLEAIHLVYIYIAPHDQIFPGVSLCGTIPHITSQQLEEKLVNIDNINFTDFSVCQDCLGILKQILLDIHNLNISKIISTLQLDVDLFRDIDTNLLIYKEVKRNFIYSKICPQCHFVLVKRKRHDDGKEFWGCVNYPSCHYSCDLSAEDIAIEDFKQKEQERVNPTKKADFLEID